MGRIGYNIIDNVKALLVTAGLTKSSARGVLSTLFNQLGSQKSLTRSPRGTQEKSIGIEENRNAIPKKHHFYILKKFKTPPKKIFFFCSKQL